MITVQDLEEFYKLKQKIITSSYVDLEYGIRQDEYDKIILEKLGYNKYEISKYIFSKVYLNSTYGIDVDQSEFFFKIFTEDNMNNENKLTKDRFDYYKNTVINNLDNFEHIEDQFWNEYNITNLTDDYYDINSFVDKY
jgi:hypothetical protein